MGTHLLDECLPARPPGQRFLQDVSAHDEKARIEQGHEAAHWKAHNDQAIVASHHDGQI
jgi:hypothetical protein